VSRLRRTSIESGGDLAASVAQAGGGWTLESVRSPDRVSKSHLGWISSSGIVENHFKHIAKSNQRVSLDSGLKSGALHRAVSWAVCMTKSSIQAHGRVDQLTESQRRCLRLVMAHMTSKQIARELGMSPHTVDAHLKASLKALGVAGRTEAALILARAEHGEPYQSLAYQPLGIANCLQSMVFAPDGIDRLTDRAGDVDYTKLVQVDDEHNRNIVQDGITSSESISSIGGGNQSWRLGKKGEIWNRENDMSISARLIWILFISLSSMIVLTITISALQSLSSLYN